jgi:hypothetical protein
MSAQAPLLVRIRPRWLHLWPASERRAHFEDGRRPRPVSPPRAIHIPARSIGKPWMTFWSAARTLAAEGVEVSLRGRRGSVGFPAPAIWRTPAGLEVFGPAHFGFNIPYVPIEQRPPKTP